MMYSTMDKGKAPYIRKVTTAPRRLPTELVASATAIISTTYIHAIATRYISAHVDD